jgi:hypothetical protein
MDFDDLTPEQQAQAAKLFSFVNANPDVQKMVRKEAKKRNPIMQAPDLELEERLEATEKKLLEAQEKQALEQTNYIREQARKEAHAKIRSAGFEPEAIEKIMVDEDIANYDTAIKYATQAKQLAPASNPSEGRTPMTLPDTDLLWKDHRKFASVQAHEAINELKAQRLGSR